MQNINPRAKLILLLIATGVSLLIIPYTFIIQPSGAWVLAILVLPLTLHYIAHGRLIPPTAINSQLILLLIMVGVSLYATYSVEVSISKAANLITSIILFWMTTATLQQEKGIYLYGWIILLLMGLAIAMVSLTNTLWTADLPGFGAIIPSVNAFQARLNPFVPDAVPVFNANQIAGLLLWCAPFSVVVSLTAMFHYKQWSSKLAPWMAWLGLAALLGLTFFINVILILTQSRGAYLGYGVGLLLAIVVLFGKKRWWVSILFLIAIGAASAIALNRLPFLTQAGAIDQGSVNTLAGRTEIWSRALYGLQDFPFTGMGMNVFREVVHTLYPLFLMPPTADFAHAHNQFLQTGLDLGLLGLIAHLSMWLTFPVVLWQIWHKTNDVWPKAYVLGFTISLTSYFVYGITDTVALGAKTSFIFWWLLACLFALHQRMVTENHPES